MNLYYKYHILSQGILGTVYRLLLLRSVGFADLKRQDDP
jgi:hypothetical protein